MKVLIVSHVPMMTKNNMGKTLLSLFSEFEREELCQLYIYPSIPDVDRCSSYFRVTDKEVLSSFVGKRKIGGEVDHGLIYENQNLYEIAGDESIYRNRKNKSAIRRLLRDAMWALSPWYSVRLKVWLEKEKPDCIFVAPGVAKFLYNIALRIAHDRKIPIVAYVCDEYFFVRQPRQMLDKLRLHLLKKKIRQLMDSSSHLLVISQELKKEYEQEFGIDVSVVMTGAGCIAAERPTVAEAPSQICYFGNIRCNRYLVLAEIGRALDAINREFGKLYKLKIYTAEKDGQILSAFDGIESIVLCDFVTGKDYEKAFRDAQLLLHVEAFDEASMDFTQHSISTKIADSLASGIPLLAYGPEYISSMQHLLRNKCAITATSKDGLRAMLQVAFEDEGVRYSVAQNGLLAAREYHDTRISGLRVKKILTDLIR